MKKNFTIESLIVHGICPSCKQLTALVSVLDNIYKCTNCGDELKQHVNGIIKYLPLNNKKIKNLVYGEKD